MHLISHSDFIMVYFFSFRAIREEKRAIQRWTNKSTFPLNSLGRLKAESGGRVQDQERHYSQKQSAVRSWSLELSPCNRNWRRSSSMEWNILCACVFWKLTLVPWYSGGVFWFPWYPSLCSVYFQGICFNTEDKSDEQSSRVSALLQFEFKMRMASHK